jgi:glycosyltransferase involved in cell wall biosynthesis
VTPPGKQGRSARRPPLPDVSAIVYGDLAHLGLTLNALARQSLGERRLEVLVIRSWPHAAGVEAPAGSGGVGFLDVAAASPTMAVNAGIEAARGPVVLLLDAGDVPAADDLLAQHLDAQTGGSVAVTGTSISPDDPVRTGWVGTWPLQAPAPPTHHVSLDRAAVVEAGGLDERLAVVEVAVVDLLARLAAAGQRVAERDELAVRAPAATREAALARCAEAGRSARALASLLAERGDPSRELGPLRARVALRWLGPAVRLGARLAGTRGGRAHTLVHRAAFARGLGRFPPPLERPGRGGIASGGDNPPTRPEVAIVVPFAGTDGEGEALLDALDAVQRGPGDEVVVVDNSRAPVLRPRERVRVIRADREWSSYHARNTGAAATSAPWLLFVDSDCRPAPWLLDAYFAEEIGGDTGAVAGGILAAPWHTGWVARWSAEMEVLSQARSLGRPSRPYAVTANLLVRRSAFERLGGFAEGVRSAGDTEFSWRLADDGWAVEYRPRAAVLHLHRTTLRGLVSQYRRYGAGAAWLGRRYPGALDGWPTLRRAMLTEPLVDLVAGRFELSVMRTTELATLAGALAGALGSNRPAGADDSRAAGVAAFAAAYPDADAPAAVERVDALGPDVAVEARRRPLRFVRPRPRGPVAYAEDDAPLDWLAALRWLARQPGGRAVLAGAAVQGRHALRALAGDAAVARRVAKRGAHRLAAVDDDVSVAAALAQVTELLGLPSAKPAGIAAPQDAA